MPNSWNRFFRLLPLPGTHPLTKQKIGEEITVRENETWNHAHPHASLPLAVKPRSPFVRLLFPGEGGAALDADRNEGGISREGTKCNAFSASRCLDPKPRYVLRFAPQLHGKDFESWAGNTASGRFFEISRVRWLFASFFVFSLRAKIRRRSIVVVFRIPSLFSRLLFSVFRIIIFLSTDEIYLNLDSTNFPKTDISENKIQM